MRPVWVEAKAFFEKGLWGKRAGPIWAKAQPESGQVSVIGGRAPFCPWSSAVLSFIRRLARARKGATLTEYALLLTLLAGLVFVGMLNLGTITVSLFETANERIAFASAAVDGDKREKAAPMVVRVDTGLGGGSAVGFVFESTSGMVDLEVDWGDGSRPDVVFGAGPLYYEYASPGVYTIQVRGSFDGLTMTGLSADMTGKVVAVSSWGDARPTSLKGAFERTANLASLPSNMPTSVRNLSGMLFGSRYNGAEIGMWNVSRVTDMSMLFSANTAFNQDLGFWNTGRVETMASMFRGATAFNQDISGWNVGRVQDFSRMFQGALFAQDIGVWDTAAATRMEGMFRDNPSFNHDLSEWSVGNVASFADMFAGARSFNGALDGWDVGSARDMSRMFEGATAFNQPLGGWNTSGVTTMEAMFAESGFNGDIANWDTGAVQDFSAMFQRNAAFAGEIGAWNTGAARTMDSMFEAATSFNANIGGWQTGGVETMAYMFAGASAFNGDISGWSTGGVGRMESMFENASSFNRNLAGWDISGVQSPAALARMLSGTAAFTGDLSCWDVARFDTAPHQFADGSSMVAAPQWGAARPAACS